MPNKKKQSDILKQDRRQIIGLIAKKTKELNSLKTVNKTLIDQIERWELIERADREDNVISIPF